MVVAIGLNKIPLLCGHMSRPCQHRSHFKARAGWCEVGPMKGTCRQGLCCRGFDPLGSGLPPLYCGVLWDGGLLPINGQPVGVHAHFYWAPARQLRNALQQPSSFSWAAHAAASMKPLQQAATGAAFYWVRRRMGRRMQGNTAMHVPHPHHRAGPAGRRCPESRWRCQRWLLSGCHTRRWAACRKTMLRLAAMQHASSS